MSVLDIAAAARARRLKQAWRVLGAEPGPGPDFRVLPLSDLMFQLQPLTEAGEAFAMMFYPLRLVAGGARLAAFKQHCTQFELTFEIKWAMEVQEL